MKQAPLKLILAGLSIFGTALQAQRVEFKTLIETSRRYQLPLPPEGASLILAHTGWYVQGNESGNWDLGIYSPAFLLEEKTDGTLVVLRGAKKEVLNPMGAEPLWFPFSTRKTNPKLAGHVVSFGNVSSFLCAVQMAAIGERNTARKIWARFSLANIGHDELIFSQILKLKSDSRLLLGRCLFDHQKDLLSEKGADWSEIYARIGALFEEFPELKEEPAPQKTFKGLSAAISASVPKPDSVEDLLLKWSREANKTRHLGLFHEENRGVADAPARAILLRGAGVIPELIALLGDQRLTVHEVSAFMKAPARLQTVGELAHVLLGMITGLERVPDEAELDEKQFKQWYENQRHAGEAESLAQSVFVLRGGEITDVNAVPAFILAERFPEKLLTLCDEFSEQAAADALPYSLAEAIAGANLSKEIRTKALVDFATRGSLGHKRCVLQNLAKLDEVKCSELVLPLLDTFPKDATGPYWTCPEAAFTHVVMQLEDDAVWKKYLQAARRSSVGLRMEMMVPLNYLYIGAKNRERRLAFLAAFLEDKEKKEENKFNGPCAAFNLPNITVSDFATYQMVPILGLYDVPDKHWTPSQWGELHANVRLKLADETLPDYTSI
jgi:hypothetical protein